jgi:Ser/Thr protein kinase RdoA (MazF antagonist)
MFYRDELHPSALDNSLKEVEGHIQRELVRRFPDLAANVSMRTRPLATGSSHSIIILETDTHPVRRVLVKGGKRHEFIWQSLDVENKVLTDIGPKIREQNPATRCPEAIAYFPEQKLLLTEMVEGQTLYSLLFGYHPTTSTHEVLTFIRLCGDWLASFHMLTRTGKYGNPFDWLREVFDWGPFATIFQKYGGAENYGTARRLLDRFGGTYQSFRQELCAVHGEFTPYHVLVNNASVYVIDLASSRSGYCYQDLACFLTFYDVVMPWRRVPATFKLEFETQKQAFLGAYFARAPLLSEPERITLRFMRLYCMVMAAAWIQPRHNWRQRIYSSLAGFWIGHQLRVACAAEWNTLTREDPSLEDNA